MSGLKKISSKKPIKRVPFDLLDDFSIYCHLLKLKDLTQEQIADILGKDRCTILYHLNRYTDKNQFSKPFKRKVENFNEKKFISEYKKTGNMNRFFKGINELPEKAIEILKTKLT